MSYGNRSGGRGGYGSSRGGGYGSSGGSGGSRCRGCSRRRRRIAGRRQLPAGRPGVGRLVRNGLAVRFWRLMIHCGRKVLAIGALRRGIGRSRAAGLPRTAYLSRAASDGGARNHRYCIHTHRNSKPRAKRAPVPAELGITSIIYLASIYPASIYPGVRLNFKTRVAQPSRPAPSIQASQRFIPLDIPNLADACSARCASQP